MYARYLELRPVCIQETIMYLSIIYRLLYILFYSLQFKIASHELVRIVLCFFILVVDVCVLCDLHRSFLPCVTAIMTLPEMIMISASLHETFNRGIREM